jgi:hypothetical protein
MTRDNLAITVIVFDILICAFFIAFVEYALFLIDKEE